MPGIEIKGRSKIANYRHGGRAGYALGSIVKGAKKIISKIKKPKPKDRWETLDTKVKGKMILGPEKGKYKGIDKVMKNIKKSGDIWGPGKAKGGRIGLRHGGSAGAAKRGFNKKILRKD